jgi:hypothetical protein
MRGGGELVSEKGMEATSASAARLIAAKSGAGAL